jgi:hypothetical protein
VVTADAVATATSISISPAIVTSGPYQNVTASPTTGQPYVIKGAASTSYGCNVGFHEDAFTLAMVPMATPPDGTGARVEQISHNGYTIKVTDFYDGTNDNVSHPARCAVRVGGDVSGAGRQVLHGLNDGL